ncbi:MAG: hypothetical protein AKCLJLPJ_02357 [Fimbriimonadales bacterium]|nr:hypothetical protein [Fimbriimonadales bacterium]
MHLPFADRALLNTSEAARHLRVSWQSGGRLKDEGLLRWFKFGSGGRIGTRGIEQYLEPQAKSDMGRAR